MINTGSTEYVYIPTMLESKIDFDKSFKEFWDDLLQGKKMEERNKKLQKIIIKINGTQNQ